MTDEISEINELIKGMKDCHDGVKHESKTDAYNRGYAAQYELEQVMTNLQGVKHGYKNAKGAAK